MAVHNGDTLGKFQADDLPPLTPRMLMSSVGEPPSPSY